MAYILALDQGTTSSRALLFDEAGTIVAAAQREFEQHFPRPGWVEHDPEAIWSSQLAVAREAVAEAKARADEIAAIGLTNQRETTLLWDRATGEPVHRAIVWQDRRTAGLCDELRAAGHEALVAERTGLVIDAYFSGTKLRWLLENVPGARERAVAGQLAFGTVDTWLLWNLTGGRVHATDTTNAARTMLLDIHRGAWDDELLAMLDIPPAVLPAVRGSSEIVGEVDPAILGVGGGRPIPLAGVAGDQQAALFGQRCTQPGMAKCTYGTGCFVLMNIGGQAVASRNRMLTTVAWAIDDVLTYALEGSIFIGGAVVQWLRDGLGLIESAGQIEALAASVVDNGGVYLVPAFAGLGAPHWDPYARGTIVGLTRGATAGHIARAALEGIAFQVADVLEAMQADAAVPMRELRVDGGAAGNDLLMQFQADVLRVPVVRPRMTETTAAGAAYLAGLASGLWREGQVDALWQAERRFEPTMAQDEAARLRRRWAAAVERARAWAEE
ncbi:MAG: glycerol kinase GlpK [Phycisphaeraceae bacterium]